MDHNEENNFSLIYNLQIIWLFWVFGTWEPSLSVRYGAAVTWVFFEIDGGMRSWGNLDR